jgi:hypothetical protein
LDSPAHCYCPRNQKICPNSPLSWNPSIHSFKIVETDASEIGYGGILKQKVHSTQPEQLVRFHSGVWTSSQQNYSTIKKEILSIVLCITKFQDDLLNQKFFFVLIANLQNMF